MRKIGRQHCAERFGLSRRRRLGLLSSRVLPGQDRRVVFFRYRPSGRGGHRQYVADLDAELRLADAALERPPPPFRSRTKNIGISSSGSKCSLLPGGRVSCRTLASVNFMAWPSSLGSNWEARQSGLACSCALSGQGKYAQFRGETRLPRASAALCTDQCADGWSWELREKVAARNHVLGQWRREGHRAQRAPFAREKSASTAESGFSRSF
jgi:hypothetical protein